MQHEQVLPQRQSARLAKTCAACEATLLRLDGTERPIRRPENPEKQEIGYSGKKKRHTVKNLVLSEHRTVQFLSPTAPGSHSDKRLAEPLEPVHFPQPSLLVTDLGFEGLKVRGIGLVQPAKKPKGRPLSADLRSLNHTIASLRVKVEHVIGSIKRCRIVNDILRHMKQGYEDLVMEVACGLHNWRERYRRRVGPVVVLI